MEDPKKVLQMNFVTKDGGSFRISVGNTLDELTAGQVSAAMDIIVGANVYITKTGTKYHRANCSSLRKSKISISLKEAKERYEPCKICKP